MKRMKLAAKFAGILLAVVMVLALTGCENIEDKYLKELETLVEKFEAAAETGDTSLYEEISNLRSKEEYKKLPQDSDFSEERKASVEALNARVNESFYLGNLAGWANFLEAIVESGEIYEDTEISLFAESLKECSCEAFNYVKSKRDAVYKLQERIKAAYLKAYEQVVEEFESVVESISGLNSYLPSLSACDEFFQYQMMFDYNGDGSFATALNERYKAAKEKSYTTFWNTSSLNSKRLEIIANRLKSQPQAELPAGSYKTKQFAIYNRKFNDYGTSPEDGTSKIMETLKYEIKYAINNGFYFSSLELKEDGSYTSENITYFGWKEKFSPIYKYDGIYYKIHYYDSTDFDTSNPALVFDVFIPKS